jgi:hypothetical protein
MSTPGDPPPFGDLGICGAQWAGSTAGISVLILESGWAPAAEDRLVFCEGFAEGPDGTKWAWELWTRNEFGRCRTPEDTEPEPVKIVAELDLVSGKPPAEVIERDGGAGWHFTQVVVPVPWFGLALLERLRTAPASERSLIFTPVPTDDDAGDLQEAD